jgi:hypothetical protein
MLCAPRLNILPTFSASDAATSGIEGKAQISAIQKTE